MTIEEMTGRSLGQRFILPLPNTVPQVDSELEIIAF